MRENQDNIHKELKEIAPFLAQIRQKETKLEAPNGYFNHLEDNILACIKAEEETQNWSSTSLKANEATPQNWLLAIKKWLLRPSVGIGFAMILIVSIFSIIWSNSQSSDAILMAVSEIEATEYIHENIDQFSETLILESVIGEDWTTIEISDEIEIDFDKYIEDDLIDELDSELINELL
ncbi:MAG: hypothetical protein ACPG19_05950 [Saprospiraceae bacterium]